VQAVTSIANSSDANAVACRGRKRRWRDPDATRTSSATSGSRLSPRIGKTGGCAFLPRGGFALIRAHARQYATQCARRGYRPSRSTTVTTISGVLRKRCGAHHRFMARSGVRRLFNSSRAILPPICRRAATSAVTTNTTARMAMSSSGRSFIRGSRRITGGQYRRADDLSTASTVGRPGRGEILVMLLVCASGLHIAVGRDSRGVGSSSSATSRSSGRSTSSNRSSGSTSSSGSGGSSSGSGSSGTWRPTRRQLRPLTHRWRTRRLTRCR
jgi:hypothetical protein